MIDILLLFMWFGVIVAWHEIGHILTFMYFHRRMPVLVFKWWGVLVGTDEDRLYDTPFQYSVMLYSGIVFGFIPLLAFLLIGSDSDFRLLTIAYLFACVLDLGNLWLILRSKWFKTAKCTNDLYIKETGKTYRKLLTLKHSRKTPD